MRYPAFGFVRVFAPRRIAACIFLGILLAGLAGCGGDKVIVPIRTLDLPARAADAPVDVYWSQKSVENWFKLATDEKKAPDLEAEHLNDTHKLWENRDAGLSGAKVADLEASGNISPKHPREWLLVDLAARARELGADAIIINSVRVATPTGHVMRDTNDAMWSDGISVKVWLYAQALHYQ